MKPRILIMDPFPDDGLKELKKFATVVDGIGYTVEKLYDAIAEFDSLIVRSNNKIPRSLIEKAVNLKVIGRAGSGLDNIDLEAAKENNISVINSPEGNVCSVAEYTVCMMIYLAHRINEAHEGPKTNNFQRHVWKGRNIKNMTVGLIGLGRIGAGVLEKILPLCKNVIGYDPYVKQHSFSSYPNFRFASSLDELLKACDIISLHVPLTAETKEMINEKTIQKLKRDVILINTSRGQLINENALIMAFKEGIISSAALDSIDPDPDYNVAPEDCMYSHHLINHPKVYYTPHVAAYTTDALNEVALNLVNKIRSHFEANFITVK